MSLYINSKSPGKVAAKKKRWKKRPKPYNAPKLEDLELVLGRWKVTKVLYESCDDDDEELDKLNDEDKGVYLPECEGVEVMFDDQCDITWYVPKGVDPIPLFQTTSFNIERELMDLIGGEDGKTFKFLVESIADENRKLVLKTPVDESYEEEAGEMVIIIEKVSSTSVIIVDNFSLKDALDDGFFSDLTIRSSEGTVFHVHKIVLACSSTQVSYSEWEILLSAFKAPLVKVILEYLYTDNLPANLSLSLAKELSTAISTNHKLARLHELCKAFIESNNLKHRLMGLVDDLQSSLELAKRIVENIEMTNPVKVTYAIKQLAKEAAAGAAKLGLLCELYTRNRKEMSKKEKQEVLEYVRGRVVVFMDLLNELIELGLSKFNQLAENQKLEMATYIIPEVERIWDMVNVTSKEVEAAMIAKVKSLDLRRSHFRRQDIKVAIILQFIAKGRELKRLQKIGKEFEDFVIHSHRKREEFREWAEVEKADKIIKVMEGLEGEGLNQMEQLTDLKKDILMDNALDWKKFKILVTVCCSYVSWGIRKVQALKTALYPVLLKGCKFIQKPEINDILVYFDLLSDSDLEQLRDDDLDEGVTKTVMPGLQSSSIVSENLLAQGCHKLLASRDYSDMTFVLMPNAPPILTPYTEGGCDDELMAATGAGREGVGVIDHTHNSTEDDSVGGGGVVIPAHRVIVAARCEYFKRALQSGMKEAINKCIVIHECEEAVFHMFLHYLYGGTLDTTTMTLNDIIELLAVADRYETTSLRTMCEGLLVDRVEDGSVFALLQVADHYSARRLREATLLHIIADTEVLMKEVEAYSNLPDDLKDEIRSLLSSANPHLALRHSHQVRRTSGRRSDSVSTTGSSSSADTSNSSSNNMEDLLTSSVEGPYHFDNIYHTSETLAFQGALKELRGIVGDEPSDEVLKDILLAADMDINRAVNFYFS